nr:hypothetical protein BN993_02079 [Virgibacillus halodenitrificans]
MVSSNIYSGIVDCELLKALLVYTEYQPTNEHHKLFFFNL